MTEVVAQDEHWWIITSAALAEPLTNPAVSKLCLLIGDSV